MHEDFEKGHITEEEKDIHCQNINTMKISKLPPSSFRYVKKVCNRSFYSRKKERIAKKNNESKSL